MSENQGSLLHGIRVVLLDAVGTVMTPSPGVDEVYARYGREYGSCLDPAEISRQFRKVFRQTERNEVGPIAEEGAQGELRTSERNEHRRWRHIVGAVLHDLEDADPCFDALWNHFSDPRHWRLYDEVASVVARLHADGKVLAIASNFDGRLHRVCDGLPGISGITTRLISSEVGWRKPAGEFFQASLQRLRADVPDLRPGEILVVGDDVENDVVGAQAAGLRAVRVNRRTEPATGELRSLTELWR